MVDAPPMALELLTDDFSKLTAALAQGNFPNEQCVPADAASISFGNCKIEFKPGQATFQLASRELKLTIERPRLRSDFRGLRGECVDCELIDGSKLSGRGYFFGDGSFYFRPRREHRSVRHSFGQMVP
jgi:hypothetical protein